MIRINEYRDSKGKLILKYKNAETNTVILEIYQDNKIIDKLEFPSWSKSCNFISKQNVTKVASCMDKTVEECKRELNL